MDWLWSFSAWQWQWPWVLLLFPLPWLYRYVLPPVKREQTALYIPFAEDYEQDSGSSILGQHQKRFAWRYWLAIFAWLLLLLATARPVWVGQPVQLPLSGRDLMMAVDLSGSMQIQDFVLHGQAVDRLTATKSIAGDFIERRQGDRIGLILFGSQAYIQAPLTFDTVTVLRLLQESAIGLAGKETAIGDAVGLAVKRLEPQKGTQKVLVLLTDGVNTTGQLKPLEAAEVAANHGLRLYTIGIGADEMLVPSLFGSRRVNPSRDLDEQTLKSMADATGGRYFRARNADELEHIYQLIDQLEPVKRDQRMFRPMHSLYMWPLTLAMFCSLLLLGETWWRRR